MLAAQELLFAAYQSAVAAVQPAALIRAALSICSKDQVLLVKEDTSYSYNNKHSNDANPTTFQIPLTNRDVYLFGAGK